MKCGWKIQTRNWSIYDVRLIKNELKFAKSLGTAYWGKKYELKDGVF